MRIVSLLPSATEIVFALGLGDELVGVSHECDWPPEARDRPIVTHAVHDPSRAPSHAIHRLVDGSAQAGASIRVLDADALAEARPDLVLTQGPCRTCALGPREVGELVRGPGGEVAVLSLEPTSVEGIFNAIQAIGAMTEAEDAALDVVEDLRERLRAVEEIVLARREHGLVPPRVAAIGWLDPPHAVGRWIPEQVRRAGGWELLGREGEQAVATTWDAVREVDPDTLVLMPAGLHLRETIEAWERTGRPPKWEDTRAVHEGRVFAVDGSSFFARPGPRVVDGIELLAELLDPLAFDGMAPLDSWAKVG